MIKINNQVLYALACKERDAYKAMDKYHYPAPPCLKKGEGAQKKGCITY